MLDELTRSMRELRGSLVEVLSASGTDPERPQEISRALGLDKSLAWKVARLARASDAGMEAAHLPGAAAFEILLSAAARKGVQPPLIARARDAVRALSSVVDEHLGDRPTLELVLDGMPRRGHDRLAMCRKLAFRGNSGLWGIQARTRVNAFLLACSRDSPDQVDCAMIGGWAQMRRLRADARWAIFRRLAHGPGGAPGNPCEPIVPGADRDGLMLMREFCSDTLPAIRTVVEGGSTVYEIGDSPVGARGAFNCFLGTVQRRLGSVHATENDTTGSLFALVSAPVQLLVVDLLVHEGCPIGREPAVDVYGALTPRPGERSERDRLPLRPKITALPRVGEATRVPGVDRYSAMLERAAGALGDYSLSSFAGVRILLEYPPFPSTAVVTFPLLPPG